MGAHTTTTNKLSADVMKSAGFVLINLCASNFHMQIYFLNCFVTHFVVFYRKKSSIVCVCVLSPSINKKDPPKRKKCVIKLDISWMFHNIVKHPATI